MDTPKTLADKRNLNGMPAKTTHLPQEFRDKVIEDAKQRILDGHTIAQIAESHSIAPRTLRYWLSSLGEEYNELRRAWIDNMLSEAYEEINDAQDVLPLARAREKWKAVTWYAERRDRQRYGVQQQTANNQDLTVTINIGSHDNGSVTINAEPSYPQD